MGVGHEILQTAFYDFQKTPKKRIRIIDKLSARAVRGTSFDQTVGATSPAFIALIEREDPTKYADQILERCLRVSKSVINPVSTEFALNHNKGLPSELAIHNLLWWATVNRTDIPCRYARLTTIDEDSSTGSSPRKNGHDIALRTYERRHRIQVKDNLRTAAKHDRYEKDIIVVAPGTILEDPSGTSATIHDALIHDDRILLGSATSRLIHELLNQKVAAGDDPRLF